MSSTFLASELNSLFQKRSGGNGLVLMRRQTLQAGGDSTPLLVDMGNSEQKVALTPTLLSGLCGPGGHIRQMIIWKIPDHRKTEILENHSKTYDMTG